MLDNFFTRFSRLFHAPPDAGRNFSSQAAVDGVFHFLLTFLPLAALLGQRISDPLVQAAAGAVVAGAKYEKKRSRSNFYDFQYCE